jgi:hypothetical protein
MNLDYDQVILVCFNILVQLWFVIFWFICDWARLLKALVLFWIIDETYAVNFVMRCNMS